VGIARALAFLSGLVLALALALALVLHYFITAGIDIHFSYNKNCFSFRDFRKKHTIYMDPKHGTIFDKQGTKYNHFAWVPWK
jgi:hypothetical protein